MKIIIPTIGSRGDVQPYIALALGLQGAGHAVTLATHPAMCKLVDSYGVQFAPVGPDIDIGHETAIIRGRSPNWLTGFMRVMRFSFTMLEQIHPDLLKLCRGVDLVIVSHTAAGSIEADKLGIPAVSVTLMPHAIPVNDPHDPFIKRLLPKVAGMGMGLIMTRPLNRIRTRTGLPPMGPTGITSEALNLIPLSPHVFPPDPRWEPRHRMTGYWFSPFPKTWTAPHSLQAFLDGGDPPVVISLGAMALSGDDALEAAQITVSAVQMAGIRAIIQGWDEPMKSIELPPTIFHAGSVPHDWLLERAVALVHHGGFGTTAAGFRAGIPSLVIPHIIDQFIWGQRVLELGVGPKPISRAKLTVQSLAESLVQLAQDSAMRARAAELGEKISLEQGVENAVGHIHREVTE